MNKSISISIITILLISFALFSFLSNSNYIVLKVINASEIQIDINKNGVVDLNENFCIPNIQTLTSELNYNQDSLTKTLNITKEDGIKYGYLSDNYAETILLGKRVKIKPTGIKNPSCNYADIIVNNESYRNKLLISGYGIENGKAQKQFLDNLKKARNLNLVILNHRSGKYHKLDCEYGLAARDSIIVPEKQLTDEVHPCKFCHVEKSDANKTQIIKTYPLAISNGNIKLYLTDLTTKLKPDRNCTSLVCQEFVSQIKNSKEKIDIALYGWDNIPLIYNALKDAKTRGVEIRIVYDISNPQYYKETQNIVDLADKSRGDGKTHFMHNKFVIIDQNIVITGSMNFSETGFSGFNSNSIFFINSNDIAKIYTREFEQMLSGKFKNAKEKIEHKTVQIGSTKVTPLFSPKDKIITEHIIPLIQNAKSYIYIPAFIITHNKLSSELISAKQRGVDVKIIIDATSTTANKNKIKALRQAGIPVKIENYAGKIHSKTIIIDDKYLIAGSMNFTSNGENLNDENTIIIENSRFAKYYKGFFEYIWDKIPDKYLEHYISPESKYSIGSCHDGIDNDYDGNIDMKDKACN